MKNSNPTVGDVFGIAIKAEGEAQLYYEGLAAIFPEPPSVSEFWRDLANDESEHIHAIESMRETLSPDMLASPENPDIPFKMEEFLKFSAQDTLDQIENLDQAYRTAVNLEFSELNKLMEMLIVSHVRSEELRRAMKRKMDDHLAKIKALPKRFGDAKWRRGITPKKKGGGLPARPSTIGG